MVNYTEEQRNAILQMPSAVLLSAMLAEPGSKITNIQEFVAGEQFISQSAKNYPQNKLVQDMLINAGMSRMESAFKYMFSFGDKARMLAECESKVNVGASVLEHDEEGNQFRAFLVKLAEVVVNATGGGFLGTKGEKVSPQEAQYVEQLKQKLAVASY